MAPRESSLPPIVDLDGLLSALARVDLLQGLPREVLMDVAAVCTLKRYHARQEVIARDDVDRDCFFVLHGRLRVIAWSPGGREVSFRDVGEGATVGELAAIDGRPRSASVVALTETRVARLSPEALVDLLRRHWPICQRLLRRLAAAARDMTERVYELSTLNVQQRLCAELLRLALADERPDGGTTAVHGAGGLGVPARASRSLRPAPSHAELAARIGSVREQVTRELGELESSGLVAKGQGELLLPDLQRLAERVEGQRA